MPARRAVWATAGCPARRGEHGGPGRQQGGCRGRAAPWARPDHSSATGGHAAARSAATPSRRRPVPAYVHRRLPRCARRLPVPSRPSPVRERRPAGAPARRAARPAAPRCAPGAECSVVLTRQTSGRTVMNRMRKVIVGGSTVRRFCWRAPGPDTAGTSANATCSGLDCP
ncbi:hypothetical protein STPH2_1393 [Streptomyces sp. KO7888]|nr:hypothetical protein [Streptomyces sp. KO7888]